jgi:hypothetical protein
MDLSRIYTKTSKGILEGNAKTRVLTREHGRVLVFIDGKSTLSEILEKNTRLSQSRLASILDELVEAGFIRLLSGDLAVDDLGFSSTIIVSEANTQAFFEAQADVERESRRAEDRDARTKIADRESLMKELKADIDAEAEALKRQAQKQAEQDLAHQQEEAVRQAKQVRQATDAARESAQAKAKSQSEAEARARAETQALMRLEAEKKARQQAEKKIEEATRAREAAERRARDEMQAKALLAKAAAASAQRELEAKILAEEEAQHRAEMEARLREMEHAKNQAQEEVQTLSKALDDARVAAELETRVKRRIEARAREEAEVRDRKLVAEQAKREQETKQRAEAEAQEHLAAEAQVTREQEAQRQAEENARLEAERQAQAKIEAEREAREEADKKLRALAQAQAQAEKEAQERLAAEALATREQEAQRQAEENARLEAERQAQAKIEAEREAREEAEKKARALAEAQAEKDAQERAEAAARMLAEEETRMEAARQAQAIEAMRVHAEGEARAVAEAEEAIRLEVEAAKRKLQEEEREDAARRAHAAAERELEAERQTRAAAEATARALAEERAKIEAAAQSRAEEGQRARAQADAEARAETKAALRRVQDETQQEEQDEARLREEAEVRAIAAAQGAQAFPFLTVPRKRARFDKRWGKLFVSGIAALLLLTIGAAHLVPFNFYIPELERQLADSLGQRVVVQNIRFSAFPTPHIKLEGVTIGDLASVRIAQARLFPSVSSWFSETKVMRRVELDSLTLAEDSVSALPVWSLHQGKTAPIHFQHLQVKDAKLTLRLLNGLVFDADMDVDKGHFVKAQMKSVDRHITIDFLPQGEALHVDFSAVNSALPLEPRLHFDTLKISALVRGDTLTANSVEGQLYGGSLSGTAQINWRKGWQFSADIGVQRVAIEPSLLVFTRDIKIDGTLEAKMRLAIQSATLEELFSAPQMQATFRAKNGEFSGIDLVHAIQAPSRTGNVGGKTHFNELSGAMRLTNGHYQYRQIKLQGGVISGAGNLDISPERNLSGNLVGEFHTRATTIRTPFTFGGTLTSPTLKAAPRAVAPVSAPPEEDAVQ